jgi:hypothetical protein
MPPVFSPGRAVHPQTQRHAIKTAHKLGFIMFTFIEHPPLCIAIPQDSSFSHPGFQQLKATNSPKAITT